MDSDKYNFNKINNLISPMNKIYRDYKKISDSISPIIRASEDVGYLNNDMYREAMKSLDPFKEIRDNFLISPSMIVHRDIFSDQLNNIIKNHNEIRKYSFFDNLNTKILISRFNSMNPSTIKNELEILLTTNIYNNERDINFEEISEELLELTNEINSSNLKENLNKLSKFSIFILIWIVLPHVHSVFANLATPFYLEILNNPNFYKTDDPKIDSLEEFYLINDLKKFRYICCEKIIIYEFGYSKSSQIGELKSGDVVSLVTKTKSWSYVEYKDIDSGKIKLGWVYTRYLKKLS